MKKFSFMIVVSSPEDGFGPEGIMVSGSPEFILGVITVYKLAPKLQTVQAVGNRLFRWDELFGHPALKRIVGYSTLESFERYCGCGGNFENTLGFFNGKYPDTVFIKEGEVTPPVLAHEIAHLVLFHENSYGSGRDTIEDDEKIALKIEAGFTDELLRVHREMQKAQG